MSLLVCVVLNYKFLLLVQTQFVNIVIDVGGGGGGPELMCVISSCYGDRKAVYNM